MPSTPSSSPDHRRGLTVRIGLLGLATVAAVTAVVVTSGDEENDVELARCNQSLSREVTVLEVGDKVPDFTLPTLNGECFRLADSRGRPLVVNFWASWCNPCREEFPLFRDALDEHAEQQLEIVGVDHDDIASDARRFAQDQRADWPLIYDGDDIIAELFGVRPIPQTFFVRRDGTIASRIYGFTSTRELERELNKILNT